MPEGPELHLASRFVNQACHGLVFSGAVEKSPVSRNPEVPFESSAYCISATARASHDPRLALCFVDIRRFGRWDLGGEWQPDRGPCVLLEYEHFRENVLRNLADKAFNRPICEALLDQRFFNGIGNYLRAEILFRLRIPPFEKARTVLEALQHHRLSQELTLSQKIRVKLQNPDLLELCHLVPKEVVQLGGKGYGPDHGEEDFAAFRAWLQCYSVPGMSSLRDRSGRTIWFQGDPGPLAPKGGKSRKKKSQEIHPRPLDGMEHPPPLIKGPSKTPGTEQDLPEVTAACKAKDPGLQHDPGVPTVHEKGRRRRRRRQATTGHRKPQKRKADTPSEEPAGTIVS